MMMVEHKVREMRSNTTDKKVMIKRRGDGVYDVYVNDEHVGHKGSIQTAVDFVSFLLAEE